MYSKVGYFEGAHHAHIATYKEHRRLLKVHLAIQQCYRESSSQRAPEAWESYLTTASAPPPAGFHRHVPDVQSM
jgi:hypothetical protein